MPFLFIDIYHFQILHFIQSKYQEYDFYAYSHDLQDYYK